MYSSIRCGRLAIAALIAGCILMFTSFLVQSADEDDVLTARNGIANLGKRWDREAMAVTSALYIELQLTTGDRSGVEVTVDVSYGPHELQTVDVFTPVERPDELAPVVIFVHGGGMVRGNKTIANTDLIYSNIPTFFARHGIVGVNANYRLVPEVQWPSGPEDIGGMLTWVRENIEGYGGDPQKVFLMGNSAGGRHVASYLFHGPSHFADGPGVIGALLSSGSYRSGSSDALRSYYGEDAAVRAELVPLGLVDSYDGPEIPIFMWSAEFDPTMIEAPVAVMYARLCAKYSDCPRYTQFQGHNHVSHIMSINSADETVGHALLEFVSSVTH